MVQQPGHVTRRLVGEQNGGAACKRQGGIARHPGNLGRNPVPQARLRTVGMQGRLIHHRQQVEIIQAQVARASQAPQQMRVRRRGRGERKGVAAAFPGGGPEFAAVGQADGSARQRHPPGGSRGRIIIKLKGVKSLGSEQARLLQQQHRLLLAATDSRGEGSAAGNHLAGLLGAPSSRAQAVEAEAVFGIAPMAPADAADVVLVVKPGRAVVWPDVGGAQTDVQLLAGTLPALEFPIHPRPLVSAFPRFEVAPPKNGFSSRDHGIVQVGGRTVSRLGFIEMNDAVRRGDPGGRAGRRAQDDEHGRQPDPRDELQPKSRQWGEAFHGVSKR